MNFKIIAIINKKLWIYRNISIIGLNRLKLEFEMFKTVFVEVQTMSKQNLSPNRFKPFPTGLNRLKPENWLSWKCIPNPNQICSNRLKPEFEIYQTGFRENENQIWTESEPKPF